MRRRSFQDRHENITQHAGVEHAGRDGIDIDAMLPRLLRQGFDETHDRRLGYCICAQIGQRIRGAAAG